MNLNNIRIMVFVMKLNVIEKSDSKMVFLLSDTNPAFANALRRVMSFEVPVMAIEFVDFDNNTSGMFDEAVAHRLGLIPLVFPDTYNLKDECKCGGKGCSRCETVFVLDKEGPCTVRASDMKSTDDEVKPLDGNIPIVELLEGQKIKFEAVAQLGFGREHAKWQAANVGYKYSPIVKAGDDCSECINVCPVNVFEKKDGRVRAARAENCILCMKCTEFGATVSADENKIIFSVESVSGLAPKQIFEKALDELEKRSEEFIKDVKKELK